MTNKSKYDIKPLYLIRYIDEESLKQKVEDESYLMYDDLIVTQDVETLVDNLGYKSYLKKVAHALADTTGLPDACPLLNLEDLEDLRQNAGDWDNKPFEIYQLGQSLSKDDLENLFKDCIQSCWTDVVRDIEDQKAQSREYISLMEQRERDKKIFDELKMRWNF